MTKQKVPKLRFSEFTGEWEEKKLGDTARKEKYSFTGGPFGSDLKVSDYVTDGVRIIQLQNIGDGFFNNECKIYTSEEKADQLKSSNIYPGDIIISKMGNPVARAAIILNYENRYVMASDGIRLAVNKNKFNAHFILEIINNEKFRKEAISKSTGTTRLRIGLPILKNIKILLPSLPEQEKIADFLTLFDKEMELEEKKLELLKENKKGYMQKIFNQEIRFKDEFGNDYPQWEEKKLGEVLIQGSKQKVKNISDYNKLTIKLNLKGLIKSKPTRKMADRRPFYIRKKGEIIIGKQNYFNGSIAIVSEEFDGFICSNAIMSFKVKKDNIEYIYNYISQNNYLEKYKFLANGTGQKELSEKDFLNFKMILPSLPEQEKITNFLSMADEGIELMENKIEKLKEIKKGLLQQMFI
ncbi:MAG: restriction endonuclease subunit S [Fusobacterium sp.]